MRVLGGLYLAVLILLLSIGVGQYVDLKSEQTHDQNRQIQVGLERMVRLNQSLTHLITTAVSEQNSLRAASYPSIQAELDATMQAVQALSAHMMLASEIGALREEQRALRAQESQALEFMRKDQWSAAHEIMLAGDYGIALKIYEINSEAAVGALTIELANTAQQQNRLRQAALALRLAAVALLLWAGWRYSRRLQTELAEQRRLRAEVTTAKNMLEEKVHQRTAELEAANRQLETLSITDALTGLANRRRFDHYWSEEWQRAVRQGTPLAVIMVDVDHFKNYNDHYGHTLGDACLRRLGALLRVTIRRAGELAARYGGEEFVVVLPGATAQQAAETAAALLAAIEAEQIPHAASPVASVLTLSMGVATGSPRAGEDRERLIRLADEALYRAKQQGRNRVVMADTA
jgi:diguanylate cyclase (GGDEF)-like protein